MSGGPLWFQVYVWRDRGLVAEMIERAPAPGYEALVLTVDTAVLGRRERDVRRGFSLPPKIGPARSSTAPLHPGWTWDSCGAIRSASPTSPVATVGTALGGRPVGLHQRAVRPEPGVGGRRLAAVPVERPDRR